MFFDGIPLIMIIIICLTILFSYILLRVSIKQKLIEHRQTIYLKLGLYFLVLLISMILVLMIPIERENKHFHSENIPSLHAMVYEGKLHDSVKKFLIYQTEFPYREEHINIRSTISGSHYFTIDVLVEEKSEEDPTIEVFLYQTPSVFAGVDITEDIEPYKIDLHANTLAITAKDNRLSYAFFKTEFPFSQFEKNRQPMFEEDLHAGEQLVYLRIPKNVKVYVNDERTNFHYVR